MRRRRRSLVLAAVGAAVLAIGAVVVVRWGAALGLTLALGAPALDGWRARVVAPIAPEGVTIPADSGPLAADLYRPAHPRRAIVLVHGLSVLGHRQPELARLARLLAEHGQLVLVPHFPGLAAFRLDGTEVAQVLAALDHLAARGLPVAVVGLSFGAGPALLAAANRPAVRPVASFGGYADLRHVIAFVTTGVHAWAGRRHAVAHEDYNRWKLLQLLAGFATTPDERAALARVAALRLADPGADTRAAEAALGDEGRRVLRLVTNRDEARVAPLLARLSRPTLAAMDALSPLDAARRLGERLLIAHGADDPSIPYTESLRLGAAGGVPVVILESFHHTGPRPRRPLALARDGWRLLGLARALLGG